MSFERFKNTAPKKIDFDFVYKSISNLLNIFSENEITGKIPESKILEMMSFIFEYFHNEVSFEDNRFKNIPVSTRKKIIKMIEGDLPEVEELFRNSEKTEFNNWINQKFEI